MEQERCIHCINAVKGFNRDHTSVYSLNGCIHHADCVTFKTGPLQLFSSSQFHAQFNCHGCQITAALCLKLSYTMQYITLCASDPFIIIYTLI